jgi:glycosyltransferase involved in cell wall biosynthesis
MRRTIHLYPFPIASLHGGILRLRTALDATEAPELYCFAPDGTWAGPFAGLAEARTVAGTTSTDGHAASVLRRAKRALFPATLYESGRHAVAQGAVLLRRLGLDDRTIVVLHTTYLGGLTQVVRDLAARPVLDVYDLVWRAHVLDARSGSAAAAVIRSAYAASVRPREERHAAAVDAVAVAGWADWRLLQRTPAAAEWIPHAVDIEPVDRRRDDDGRLRVGMLGNFAHHPTRDSARALLTSRLASDRRVQIVLAGYGSAMALRGVDHVEVLGEVATPEAFYEAIDLAVVPVSSGAGLKLKLAEGVMAGRPVITSPLGGSGFSPELQRWLHTMRDHGGLTYEACRAVVSAHDAAGAEQAFRARLSRTVCAARYAALLAAASG